MLNFGGSVRDTKLRKLGGLPTSLAVSALALASALPFARLDFDPHHDGVMVAAAVAVRDGAVVNRDVFAQYGPVAPLLQGYALRLFDDPVLGIRLVNVLAIALVAFTMADLGRKAPRFWPVSLSVGRWAALAWIAVADYFLWVPQLPWSSTIAAAMTTAILWLGARALYFRETGESRSARWMIVAGAFVLAALPLARVNVGLGSLAAVAIVSGITLLAIPTARRLILTGLAAWTSSVLVLLVLMLISGALLPWWEQSILWPLQWAGDVGNQLGPDTFVKDVIRVFWPGLLAVSVVVATTPWWSQGDPRRRPWVGVLSVVTAIGLLLTFYRNPELPRIFLAAQVDGRSSFVDGLTRGTLTLLTFLVVAIALVAVVGTARSAAGFFKGGQARSWALTWLLLVGFALAGLLQFAPVPDSRHIWWGLPVGVMVLLSAFGRARIWSPFRNPMSPVLAAAGVAAVIAAQAYLMVPRVSELNNGVAAGMMGKVTEVTRTSEIIEALRQTVATDKAVFMVSEGAWSAFDADYHAEGAFFVDWGPDQDFDRTIMQASMVVTDLTPKPRLQEMLAGAGFKRVNTTRHLLVWSRP